MSSMGSSCLPSGVPTRNTSGCVPASTWAQAGQRPHAVSGAGGRSHSSALASSRANRCLPTPSGPTNRNAWPNRLRA